jgi:hypothetical protein
MSNYPAGDTRTETGHDRANRGRAPRATTETRPAWKTTELIAYIAAVVGVLIASAVVDQGDDGQGFGASTAWWYVTVLTVGYMVSRGLAKAGSYEKDEDPRTS